jgi:hypothetical protein
MAIQVQSVRAAVVQVAPVAFDRERTLEKVRTLTAGAASQGVQIVVFPEAFVSAYPRGLTFGVVVGNRTPEGGWVIPLTYGELTDWYRNIKKARGCTIQW